METGSRINGVSAENVLEIQFKGLISLVYMFFGTQNLNLRSILKPEVEFMVFLSMHSNKITKNGGKMLLKCSLNA